MTVHLTNLADLEAVNEVYTTFFPDSAIARAAAYLPARSVISAAALPLGAIGCRWMRSSPHGDGTPPQQVEDRHNLVIRARNTDKAPRSPLHPDRRLLPLQPYRRPAADRHGHRQGADRLRP